MDEGVQRAVAEHAARLLHAADVIDVVPTPLDALHDALQLETLVDLQPLPIDELPGGLRNIARKLRTAALGAAALRERTIYVDQSLQVPRRRFTHAHELGHTVLPWQEQAYVADDLGRLSHDVRESFEAEANLFAAELLFQGDRFHTIADQHPLSLGVPIEQANPFGVSIHAAIRRYVYKTERPCALAVLGRFLGGSAENRKVKVLYTISSRSFATQFGDLATLLPQWLESEASPLASDAVNLLTGDADGLVTGRWRLAETRIGGLPIEYELFSNQRQVFALLRKRRLVRVARTPRIESHGG